MRKAVFLFVVFSMILTTGCGALSDIELTSEQIVLPTETATPAATVLPSPILTPAPIRTPYPTAIHTPESMPEIREEARFSVDLDGDGEDETIIVGSEEDSEAIYLCVSVAGKNNWIVVDYGWFTSAFLTQTGNGEVCLLVSIDMASEDYITCLYSFDSLKPVLRNVIYDYVYEVDGTHITLSDMVDAIGSWDYTCKFELTDEFILVQTSDMKIIQNSREPLLTVRELPVKMLVAGAYRADTLPAGTKIYPIATDGESYLCFRLEDGSEGKINFTRQESYETYINGVCESEYFEFIMYSD